MTDPTAREAIELTLAELASMLRPEHAVLAARVRRGATSPPPTRTEKSQTGDVRMLRRITMGTMGGMSDVAFGAIVDGRWVADEARDHRFRDLSVRLSGQLSRLPPSQPPDLFLVTDRVRQARWLTRPRLNRDRGSSRRSSTTDLDGSGHDVRDRRPSRRHRKRRRCRGRCRGSCRPERPG